LSRSSGLEFGSTAGDVDVLEAQQQPGAELLGGRGVAQGGIGVAEMQEAVGRGRETEDGHGEDDSG
jgi:hypothetical protein